MEPEFAAALLTTVQLMGLLYTHRKCKKRRLAAANSKKRIWVHEMNQTRNSTSVFNRFNQLKLYPDRFHEQFRMTPATFTYVLQVIVVIR